MCARSCTYCLKQSYNHLAHSPVSLPLSVSPHLTSLHFIVPHLNSHHLVQHLASTWTATCSFHGRPARMYLWRLMCTFRVEKAQNVYVSRRTRPHVHSVPGRVRLASKRPNMYTFRARAGVRSAFECLHLASKSLYLASKRPHSASKSRDIEKLTFGLEKLHLASESRNLR